MQDYHNLRVWEKAHRLAVSIRKLTETFPRTGYGALKNQMLRASQSIADNLAEGCGAASRVEFARFLDIAIKSACELEHQLESGRDFGIVPPEEWSILATEVRDVRRMTYGLRKRVLAAVSK